MVAQEQAELIDKVKSFFMTRFTVPVNPQQVEEDLKGLLENPLFKQYIFSNNIICIIDHSIPGYRYFSESVYDIMGIPASEFMEKGLPLSIGLMFPEDAQLIFPVMQKATSLIQSMAKEERPYVRLNYSMRYKVPNGEFLMYQQNIPMAFNDAGLPYLMLALISDITHYGKNNGIHYKIVLQKPEEPIKVLLAGHSGEVTTPLSDREKEVVQHLAEGLDANAIAEKLFISEGTVRTHRKNILEKTGAKNSVHLIRMAVANGWV